jgi:NTE family protein
MFRQYGRDPDEQRALNAVLASVAIPFFLEPVLPTVPRSAPTALVDGALVSSYPTALFDRTDAAPPRWPTFGVRLVSRSVFVDTGDISPVDFQLSEATREELVAGGRAPAQTFLSHWDEPAYLRHCRGVAA